MSGRTAIHGLMGAAEGRDFFMHARIGVLGVTERRQASRVYGKQGTTVRKHQQGPAILSISRSSQMRTRRKRGSRKTIPRGRPWNIQ
jgi:hypothetical protein